MPADPMTRSLGLFWRALAAFIALPLMVAFVVPWLLRPPDAQFRAIGWPVLIAGTLVLLACVRSFYTAGRGTLAPWSPPKHLVTVDLYRFSRNPMYVGVLLILTGWAAGYGSSTLWSYSAIMAIVFHLRVGERTQYRAEVLRWLGRRKLRRD